MKDSRHCDGCDASICTGLKLNPELREYLQRELEFHKKMLEHDKKDGLVSEVAFRNGIISQTKAILIHMNVENL